MNDRVPPLSGFSQKELPDLLRLSIAQNWPHTRDDWQSVLASGDVFGHRSDDGEILSCTATIPYGRLNGAELTCVSMVIVDAKARRRGLGETLVREAIRRSSAQAPRGALCLIATQDGLPLYRKLGFRVLEDLYSFRRPADGPPCPAPELGKDQTLRPLSEDMTAAITDLDRRAFGYDRGLMLKQRMAQAETGLVLFSGGTPKGYGLLTRQGTLASMGPIVAPDDRSALAILHGLMSGSDASPFRVDLPARQKALFAPLAALGFAENDVPPIMLRPADGTEAGVAVGTAEASGFSGERQCYYAIASQAFG